MYRKSVSRAESCLHLVLKMGWMHEPAFAHLWCHFSYCTCIVPVKSVKNPWLGGEVVSLKENTCKYSHPCLKKCICKQYEA